MAEEFVDVEEVYSENTNGMTVYQADKAMVDMQIVTAKRFPRNLQTAITKAKAIVTLDAEVAKKCNYSLSKGGKNITGPSVHLARIIARHYGNLRVDQKVLTADKTHASAEVTVFDLETNYAKRVTVRRSLLDKYGSRVSEDMASIISNAAAAIAFRNAVFDVVDEEIVSKVYEAALTKILGKVNTEELLSAKRLSMVEGMTRRYSNQKLTVEEICKSVGKTVIDHLTKEDLLTISGFEQAISVGEQSFETIFRPSIVKNDTQPIDRQDKEDERVLKLIQSSKKLADLEKFSNHLTTDVLREAYNLKYSELKK